MVEQQLVLRAKTGDGRAFGLLAKQYLGRIYQGAYFFLHNNEDAADISQEVFIRAYRSFGTFDAGRPLYPWLYRIMKNLCINHARRSKKETSISDDPGCLADERSGPEAELIKREECERLRLAVSQLPELHREIITLKHFQGCSYSEMADILSIPIGTVMSRLYNARKRLGGLYAALEGKEELDEGE